MVQRVGRIQESESRRVAAGGWEVGGGEWLLNGYTVSILQDKEFWRPLHNRMNILNTTKPHT